MGGMHAMEYAESVESGELKLRTALLQHLQYNHYPPVPAEMVDPCIRAINKANAGEWDAKVRMPKGITYKGKTLAPVSAMVENFHLDYFLANDEEDFYDEDE